MSSNWLNSLLLRQGHLSTSQMIQALPIVAFNEVTHHGTQLLSQVVFSSCYPCHLLPPEEVFDVFSRLPCRVH
jgi:hypothetical protein